MKFTEVILPLPFTSNFSYSIPDTMQSQIGLYWRVIVPFGKKHYYTGIVTEIHDRQPNYEVKDILMLLGDKPIINESQWLLWQWISQYYLCTVGEVYRAALPSLLKIESDSLSAVNAAVDKGFKPKTDTFIRLSDTIEIHSALESVRNAGQQKKLLEYFMSVSGWVTKSALASKSGVSASVINGLIKKGIFIAEEKIVSRLDSYDDEVEKFPEINVNQKNISSEILQSFATKGVALLTITDNESKLNVFVSLISEFLKKDKQALYLLPEISDTKKFTDKLRVIFGRRLLVYHSDCTENERVEVWNRLLDRKEAYLVLGTRSAVFLPFSQLGLVIVDEEHETSYKQQDPAPRYHARNTAMILAHRYGAKTLLCSATPSLESYFWASQGKYGRISGGNENDKSCLPEIEIVNVKEMRKKRRMNNTLFSPVLKEKMQEALDKGEQIVLFQNRRGFAPVVSCEKCGEIPRCTNCDVTLTYHKKTNRLVCHYCDYSIPLLSTCVACGNNELKMQGFGTEKVEEEIKSLFPAISSARLDLDVAKSKKTYREIIADFESGKTRILIGTQMVFKDIDIENVSVTAIISADGMMNIPDFRANERSMQLMMQIVGHAGRKKQKSAVVIQTSQSENRMFEMVKKFDYEMIAKSQLNERYLFRYPPYSRLIIIVLRSNDENMLEHIASAYSARLKEMLGDSVSDPVYPPVTRVQTLHIRHIMIKSDLTVSVSDTRAFLEKIHSEMAKNSLFRKISMYYDVEPQ
ncbi:MAG: primosomal protein N' [Tannerella sp.]|jgi:primosomal protein N' (replication factor Y)|nr:primosomal protein N' [Tannerella sp.]